MNGTCLKAVSKTPTFRFFQDFQLFQGHAFFINNTHFRLQLQRCLAFWPIFSFGVVYAVVYFQIFKNSYILPTFP